MANENIFSPSLSLLVAFILSGYPKNIGTIITIDMLDNTLNQRATFLFCCLIEKLCCQVEIPPNCLVDRCHEASKLIQVSKMKDLESHLFGAKSATINHLSISPLVHLEFPQTDRVLE